MDEWFSLVLKSLGTVIIVYALLIPLFKHHNFLSLIDGVFVFVATIILFSFVNTTSYLAFFIVIGGLMIVYGILRLFVLKDKSEWYILFHVMMKDRQALGNKLSEMIENGTIEPGMVFYDDKYPFLTRISIKDKKIKKDFFKNIDQILKTNFSYPFALKYGLFLLTFVILVIIWRY